VLGLACAGKYCVGLQLVIELIRTLSWLGAALAGYLWLLNNPCCSMLV
jgi:hypothetical protein